MSTNGGRRTRARLPHRAWVRRGDLKTLADSYQRSLLAENKSSKTVDTYLEGLRLFSVFLAEKAMPLVVANIRREHVEAFIADLLAKRKPATAHNRYRALHGFFRWCVTEGELKTSPMANMKPPAIPETPPDVLGEEELRRLLRACEGPGFAERRGSAIIWPLLDTGHASERIGRPEGRRHRFHEQRRTGARQGPPSAGVPLRPAHGTGAGPLPAHPSDE